MCPGRLWMIDTTMLKLNIPYLSQHANKTTNDCGPACCAMLAGATVDEALDRLGRPAQDRGKPAAIGELIRLLRSYGIDSTYKRPYYLVDIREHLDAGQPSILLANYELAVENPERPFAFAHFFLAVGYDDDGMFVHDPNWTGDKGAYLHLDSARLERAMRSPGWGNMPFQGVVVTRPYPFLREVVVEEAPPPVVNDDTAAIEQVIAELEKALERADGAERVLRDILEMVLGHFGE
jgi:hypothetical protein